jgi:CDP-diacylglycerol--glycerol-3-phosphate 3-phosphatidyltransferase
MATRAIEPITSWILKRIAGVLAFFHLTPNVLTVSGVFLNAGVAYLLLEGRFFLAGWMYLVVSMTDLLDGILARQKNMASTFGAFLDSVMDRFGDAIILTGLLLHYAIIHNVACVAITVAALCGAMIPSSTRARAECLMPKCKIGFMDRPDRVILLAIGLIFDRVPICLLLMAVSSLITIIDRIYFTRRALEGRERDS